MTGSDLFSDGFAWGDVAVAATPVATSQPADIARTVTPMSQPVATSSATHEALSFSQNFGWSSDDVAGVASVAVQAAMAGVSHVTRAPFATLGATHEMAVSCGIEARIPRTVASVANWSSEIELAARQRGPLCMADGAWRSLLMDARMTIQNWGSDLVALGWSTLDVFGGPSRPEHRRLDTAGLVYLLRGRTIEAIDRDTALIRATPRDTLTFYRTLKAGGGVPIWNWVEGLPSSRSGQPDGGEGEARQARYPSPRPKSTGGRFLQRTGSECA